MYEEMTTQEMDNKSFFYPKETMGTTIMAVKYNGGVIACADSSKFLYNFRDFGRRILHS